MYPYHNRIKQRIANGELTSHEYVDGYKHIKGNVLLLYFSTEPMVRPIREHKFNEYQNLI